MNAVRRRVALAILFWFLALPAFAACPAVQSDCSSPTYNNLTIKGNHTVAGTFGVTGAATFGAAGTALSVTNNAAFGTATVGLAGNKLTMTPGANSTTAFAFTQSGTAGYSFDRPIVLKPQIGAPVLTLNGSAPVLDSSTNTCGLICSNGFFGGTITSGASSVGMVSMTFSDKMLFSGTSVPQIFSIIHDIAPSANTATGNRVTFNVTQGIFGSSQSGSYTNTRINQAAQFTITAGSNEGGSSTVYQGLHTTLGVTCQMTAGATFNKSCAGSEWDLQAPTGSSYEINTQALYVHVPGNDVQGRLGPDFGLVISDAAGSLSKGYNAIVSLGGLSGGFPDQPNGAFVYASGQLASSHLATFTDTTNITFDGCEKRSPFSQTCGLQATGIAGATRLTTDGAAAASFIYRAVITNPGTSYTTNPVITIAGCTGGDVEGGLGQGNVISYFGISDRASACAAEATMTVSNEGGVTATGKLVIAGNTLNFPINSTVNIVCRVTATTLTHGGTDGVGWDINFGATMGATASTAAIVGSPAWTLDYQTSGAAAKFSGSAPAVPTADTTFGAVNLSITPTTGTWDVGGSCAMTKSSVL